MMNITCRIFIEKNANQLQKIVQTLDRILLRNFCTRPVPNALRNTKGKSKKQTVSQIKSFENKI